MNVIFLQDRTRVLSVAALGACLVCQTLVAESLSNLETVDSNGVSAWIGSLPVMLTGVLLTDPSEIGRAHV